MARRRWNGRVEIAERTMSRRHWLEWLGGAGALSLAAVAVGCDADPSRPGGADAPRGGLDAGGGGGDGQGGQDAAAMDPGPPADTSAPQPDAGPSGIAFAATPDAATTIVPWGENTVDPQDEMDLIANWSLQIDGLVEQPLTFTFAELLALPRQDQVTDFHCVEGWSVYDVPWNGVHMATLFDRVKPLSGATHVTFHCATGTNGATYDESLPLDICREPKTLLAYGADDRSLPLRHGFPLRVVIPRLLGYKGAKTVTRVELTDQPSDGFWVVRGYPYDAPVPPERLREGKY
jgi:DMSO/TMAO reductase YedYZ molybdopterin-dependent catalytic subunit